LSNEQDEKSQPNAAVYSSEFKDVMESLLKGLGKAPDKVLDIQVLARQSERVVVLPGPEPQKETPLVSQSKDDWRRVVFESIDDALSVMGRTGRDVFYEILERRYGLHKSEMADSPGRLMSTLKVMFDRTSRVFEIHALENIAEKTGIRAGSLEEAVDMLRGTGRNMEGARVHPVVGHQPKVMVEVSGAEHVAAGDPILDFLNAAQHRKQASPTGYVYHFATKAAEIQS
jgi:hypothetical protein